MWFGFGRFTLKNGISFRLKNLLVKELFNYQFWHQKRKILGDFNQMIKFERIFKSQEQGFKLEIHDLSQV